MRPSCKILGDTYETRILESIIQIDSGNLTLQEISDISNVNT
jgi:hypothetical protein